MSVGMRDLMSEVVVSGNEARPFLVFVVNHVAFFVSHRLPIALEAQRRGWRVELITGRAGSETMESQAMQVLATSGIRHTRVAFGSSSVNPLVELVGLVGLVLALIRLKPDIVHCASPKALVYGGIASRVAGIHSLVLAVSGMGYLYTSSGRRGVIRTGLKTVYQWAMKLAFAHGHKRVIVQNSEDSAWVLGQGLAAPAEVVLVPGSGVDLEIFSGVNPTEKECIVLLPARLLRDKGVVEFVEAAKTLTTQCPGWRFILAGSADYRNPSSIDTKMVSSWVSCGYVEWHGHLRDVSRIMAQAAIVCLPSYREGMPKSLLEAAAASCAVVTTDAPGCRESIIAGETGDLVPVADARTLTNVLRSLILDSERREKYGRAGRELAIRKFGLESVLVAVFEVYSSLLSTGKR